jgi:ribosomal protein L16/L10AE
MVLELFPFGFILGMAVNPTKRVRLLPMARKHKKRRRPNNRPRRLFGLRSAVRGVGFNLVSDQVYSSPVLYSLGCGLVRVRQLEAVRKTVRRKFGRRVRLLALTTHSLVRTSKPKLSRMGGGKGKVLGDQRIRLKVGQPIFRLDGLLPAHARYLATRVAIKLPIPVTVRLSKILFYVQLWYFVVVWFALVTTVGFVLFELFVVALGLGRLDPL